MTYRTFTTKFEYQDNQNNSRAGIWIQTDPLVNKYPEFSPYVYTLNNPLLFVDPNGLWIPEYDSETNTIRVVAERDDNLADLYNQLGITADEFAEKCTSPTLKDTSNNVFL